MSIFAIFLPFFETKNIGYLKDYSQFEKAISISDSTASKFFTNSFPHNVYIPGFICYIFYPWQSSTGCRAMSSHKTFME